MGLDHILPQYTCLLSFLAQFDSTYQQVPEINVPPLFSFCCINLTHTTPPLQSGTSFALHINNVQFK